MDWGELELILFAWDLMFDVRLYFLQMSYSPLSQSHVYTDPCKFLYSKFGQLTIIQFLDDELAGYFMSLISDPTLPRVDDYLFDYLVGHYIASCEWDDTAIYKTCARIAVLGIFAETYGSVAVARDRDAIIGIARIARKLHSLDPIYDVARNVAQSILCNFYKKYDRDISWYLTRIETIIGWTARDFTSKTDAFILKNLPLTLKGVSAHPDLNVMNRKNFKRLVETHCRGFGLDPDTKKSNTDDNVMYLALQFCFYSLYSKRAGYEDGIRDAIDYIAKVIILERNFKTITSLSSVNTVWDSDYMDWLSIS